MTRDGAEVAELTAEAPAGALWLQTIERRRHLPKIDPDLLRRDIDAVLDCATAVEFRAMTSMSLDEVKTHLSELIAGWTTQHERVT